MDRSHPPDRITRTTGGSKCEANPNRTENYNYKHSERLYFDENRVLSPNRRKKFKKQNTKATLNNGYALSNYLVIDTF